MAYAMPDKFGQVYSIELEGTLVKKAKKKFAGYHHVHIMRGESNDLLPEILKDITRPCLFWLDAHNSGRNSFEDMRLISLFKHNKITNNSFSRW
jgi:hypothetical protein